MSKVTGGFHLPLGKPTQQPFSSPHPHSGRKPLIRLTTCLLPQPRVRVQGSGEGTWAWLAFFGDSDTRMPRGLGAKKPLGLALGSHLVSLLHRGKGDYTMSFAIHVSKERWQEHMEPERHGLEDCVSTDHLASPVCSFSCNTM